MTYFECAFAPIAATRRDVPRVAQLVRSEGESIYEAFSPGAFTGWGKAEIPVLIEHDETKRAGTVTAIAPWRDWWNASFVLDGPHADRAADLIARCGNVSPSFSPDELDPRFAVPISAHHHATHWYLRAQLNEISVLSPSATPWFLGAKVTRTYEPKATATPTAHRHPSEPVEGEVIPDNGQIIVRHGIGTILSVGGTPFSASHDR